MKEKEICARYDAQKAERTDVENLWQLLERFVMPFRGKFYMNKETDSEPDWRRREIYDATAILAAASLAASVQGNLISPSTRWFDFRFQDPKMNDSDAAREWLEEAAEIAYYELQTSNFNLETAEGFMDLVGFGNTFIIEEEVDGKLEFSAVPLREAYFEEGYDNQVKRFYRKLEWTAVQCVDKWGLENLPKIIQTAYDSDKSTTRHFEIVYCVYERPKGTSDGVDMTKPLVNPKVLPFGYKYVLKETGTLLGEEGGYFDMPAFVLRWRTTAGTKWGHSPAVIILSTVMTLNQTIQAAIESAEKMIEPPMMTTQMGIIGDLDMRRGGITVVGDMGDLAPLPVGGEINAGILVAEDMRSMIRRAFYEDQLELKESPAMTATEVNVRYQLMQRLLGPILGRMQSDYLDRVVERTVGILIRNGKIPAPPEEIAQSGGEIKVEYIGPLPRAQKAERATSMIGWVGQLSSMAEINPELLDIPDWDKFFIDLGTMTGVPADVINSLEQIKQIRDARAQEQAKQAKIQEAQQTGEAMQSVGAGAEAIQALPPEAAAQMQGAIKG